MSGLTVVVTELLSPGLRGVISKWLIEVNPGTYVGTLSARVRDALWDEISTWVTSQELGYALLIHPDNSEQGYAMRSWGQTRYRVQDYDGLHLVSRQHDVGQIRPRAADIDPGW